MIWRAAPSQFLGYRKMPLDIQKIMSLRPDAARWGRDNSGRLAAHRIKMFEKIEDGSGCRCPACMGLAQSDHTNIQILETIEETREAGD